MSLLDNLEGKVKEEKDISSKKDKIREKRLELMMKKYELWKSPKRKISMEFFDGLEVDILDINKFCKMLSKNQYYNESFTFGGYISALVQLSYLSGHNDFHLALPDSNVNYVGSRLTGTSENPLRIQISGNVGTASGILLNNTIITFNDEALDSCGANANNSTIIFNKSIDLFTACGSVNSKYIFMDSVSEALVESAKSCEFYSPHKDLLDRIRPNLIYDSKAYLIKPNGEEVLYKK